ncbi:hypothetical protein Tco_0969761 [Tanacetum coccineum]
MFPTCPMHKLGISINLESRYVHEWRTIDPSFYNDLSDDSVAKFIALGFDCLLALDEEICPRCIGSDNLRKSGAKLNLQLTVSVMMISEILSIEESFMKSTAKAKQGDYDMWRLRIEQYFHVQDYALWDVIKNGNSFKPAAQTITNAEGTSTTQIPGLVTADEKI